MFLKTIFMLALAAGLLGCAHKGPPLYSKEPEQTIYVYALNPEAGVGLRDLIIALNPDIPKVPARLFYDSEADLYWVEASNHKLSPTLQRQASVELDRLDYLTGVNTARCKRGLCNANQFSGDDLPGVTLVARDLLASVLAMPTLSDDLLRNALFGIKQYLSAFSREYHHRHIE